MKKRDEEQIQLLHPEGIPAAKILKSRYDAIKKAIFEEAGGAGGVAFDELIEHTPKRLSPFDGRSDWYIEAVTLDLAARRELELFERAGRQWVKRPAE